jgi:methylenetetrahydrofolate reductase (NADPH)
MNVTTSPPYDGHNLLTRLLHEYSAEVTSPDRKSLDTAALMMPKGARVYIASLPSDMPDAQVPVATRLRNAGLVPVPHIVARNIHSRESLDNTLQRLTQEAGVDRALILGGDRDESAGEYHSSLHIIQTGLLEKHGIKKIAIGCYPEGHPRIPENVLNSALNDKIEAAKKAGLEVILISQVCFEAAPIIAFIKKIRQQGIAAPIRVGVAGPAKLTTLLKYAAICGVGPSLRALTRQSSITLNLLSTSTPEAVLTEVADAQAKDASMGISGVHFFTFASLAKTIEWTAQHV